MEMRIRIMKSNKYMKSSSFVIMARKRDQDRIITAL